MNKILHLNSYYIGNKLYGRMFRALSIKYDQLVYVPVRGDGLIGRNAIDDIPIYYDNILKPYHRIFYKTKIDYQKRRLEEILDLCVNPDGNGIKLIHAHTLFSDGGTAYLLGRKYGIPYIVSVRNTDLNVFYKYAIHYRSFSHRVLFGAASIVFLSRSYMTRFFALLPPRVVSAIKHRCFVIPNGIADDFLDDHIHDRHIVPVRLIVAASLDKNKNVATLIKLLHDLKLKGYLVSLSVAGEGGLLNDLQAYAQELGVTGDVQFLGKLSTPDLISALDASSIFIMVSFTETFGISYVEAMARGLPIIYTRNEGIDGYFGDGDVGYAVGPTSVDEMILAIEKINQNYGAMSNRARMAARAFSWKKIGEDYLDLYSRTIDEK